MAYSRDPAQAATIAAVVLLVFGLVRVLDRLATRHTSDQAVRQQLQLAGNSLAEHPYIANYPTTRQTTAPSRPPIGEADHLRRARQAGPTGGHRGRAR